MNAPSNRSADDRQPYGSAASTEAADPVTSLAPRHLRGAVLPRVVLLSLGVVALTIIVDRSIGPFLIPLLVASPLLVAYGYGLRAGLTSHTVVLVSVGAALLQHPTPFTEHLADMPYGPHLFWGTLLLGWPVLLVGRLRDAALRTKRVLEQALHAQQQTEAVLRRQDAESRALIAAIPDGIVRHNRDGVYLGFKPPANANFAKNPEDYIGKTFEENLAPELAAELRRHNDRLFETGEPQQFEYAIDVGAQVRYREARWCLIDDNTCIAIVRDVTDRKQVEAERERLLALTLEQQRELELRLAELETLNARLHALSVRDGLTGLYNRRHLDERLTEYVALARRYEQPLCVAITDIDHFKRVNDRFSHATGDLVLQEFATLMQQTLRQSDFIARYGGEEFVMVFPRSDLLQACDVCERLRVATEQHTWRQHHPDLHITISIGIARLSSSDHPDALLQRADARLYEAKAAGRNRVYG